MNYEVNKTRKTKIFHNLETFYYSRYIFFIFASFVTFIMILQLSFFIFGGLGINYYFDENSIIYYGDDNTWLAIIFLILFPWIGYSLAFSGEILIVRMDRKFPLFVIFGRGMLLIFAIMSGVFFEALFYLLILTITIVNKDVFISSINNKQKIATKWSYFFSSIFFISFILIFLPINILILNSENQILAIFDVISTDFAIVGWYLITKKSKWGFLLFFLSDFGYIIVYLSINAWTIIGTLLFYTLLDFTSMVIWFKNSPKYNINSI